MNEMLLQAIIEKLKKLEEGQASQSKQMAGDAKEVQEAIARHRPVIPPFPEAKVDNLTSILTQHMAVLRSPTPQQVRHTYYVKLGITGLLVTVAAFLLIMAGCYGFYRHNQYLSGESEKYTYLKTKAAGPFKACLLKLDSLYLVSPDSMYIAEMDIRKVSAFEKKNKGRKD